MARRRYGKFSRAKKTMYRGALYDSGTEASRAASLDLLQLAKKIHRWERGVSQIILDEGIGRRVSYCPDFLVWTDAHTCRAEEVKGFARDKKKRLVLPRDLRIRLILWESRFPNLPVVVVDGEGNELWRLPKKRERKVKWAS